MVDYSQFTVLIFGAGGRQILPVCKGFSELGCKVVNYCYSSLDTGALTKNKTEYIKYNLFRTRDGAYKAKCVGKVARWYTLDAGSGIFIQSIHEETIVENCKKLLDAIGWVGYANIDMVFDEKQEKQ